MEEMGIQWMEGTGYNNGLTVDWMEWVWADK